jgi:RND family efflux transporter MFP subunit
MFVTQWKILGTAMLAVMLALAGCGKPAAPASPMQGPLPVQVMTVALANVPRSDEYVGTIKSRRSATIQPQVDGNITAIRVHSGDHVKAGQVLMQIDPAKQASAVQSQQATAAQKRALYKFNQIEVDRQRKLFADGITSRDSLDQAEQAYSNSRADYDSATAATQTQRHQLGYYRLTAPFAGVVGDIPVHLGDYVSPTTMLTTVDQNDQLEVYIYLPTEKAADIHMGMKVQLLDEQGNVLDNSAIDFVSPQVDNQLQGILVKAPVSAKANLRNLQVVRARVIWGESPQPVVPVLAVSRIGGQSFVYVAESAGNGYVAHQRSVQLGDTSDNQYDVLSGLKTGDKVIISGTQFLVDGMPVKPLPAQPAAAPPTTPAQG